MGQTSKKRLLALAATGDIDHDDSVKRTKIEDGKKYVNASSGKADLSTPHGVDANGDRYWEISKMRRVTVSKFRGKTMVSIREYYEKDGQELPGKKGISLQVDQFSSLISILPKIETVLREAGESIIRPDYAKAATHSNGNEGNNGPSSIDSKVLLPSRKNIDATSDEEDEDEADE